MRRTTSIFVALMLVCSFSSLAHANYGDKESRPFSSGPSLDGLGLDKGTLGQIKDIRRANRDNKVELKYKLEKAQNSLKDLLQADSPRESAVMAAADDIGDLKTELRKLRLRTMLKINSLLTPEQRMKFRELQRERKKHKGKKHQKKMKRRHKGDF